MAAIVLPCRTDSTFYDFEIDLDAKTYLFEFRWNERAGGWFMSIYDASGAALLSGRAVVVGFPLLARFRTPALPAGELNAVDMSGTDTEAGVNDLGGRVRLLYFPFADMPSELIRG